MGLAVAVASGLGVTEAVGVTVGLPDGLLVAVLVGGGVYVATRVAVGDSVSGDAGGGGGRGWAGGGATRPTQGAGTAVAVSSARQGPLDSEPLGEGFRWGLKSTAERTDEGTARPKKHKAGRLPTVYEGPLALGSRYVPQTVKVQHRNGALYCPALYRCCLGSWCRGEARASARGGDYNWS